MLPMMAGMMGGGMQLPNMSQTTSATATGGDQSNSGGFVSHGINFGTATHGVAASSNQLLIWGGAALLVYLLVIKRK